MSPTGSGDSRVLDCAKPSYIRTYFDRILSLGQRKMVSTAVQIPISYFIAYDAIGSSTS